MNIREIINAATPGPWYRAQQIEPSFGKQFIGRVVRAEEGLDNEEIMEFSRVSIANADFIATFDPEHIALMLKKDALSDDICCAVCEHLEPITNGDCLSCPLLKFLEASVALSEYRNERGLDG